MNEWHIKLFEYYLTYPPPHHYNLWTSGGLFWGNEHTFWTCSKYFCQNFANIYAGGGTHKKSRGKIEAGENDENCVAGSGEESAESAERRRATGGRQRPQRKSMVKQG